LLSEIQECGCDIADLTPFVALADPFGFWAATTHRGITPSARNDSSKIEW
jgi:hypothetical protein